MAFADVDTGESARGRALARSVVDDGDRLPTTPRRSAHLFLMQKDPSRTKVLDQQVYEELIASLAIQSLRA